MTTSKRKIIMPMELYESPVAAFFKMTGFDLSDRFYEAQIEEYEFIVNDYLPEVKNLPRIKLDPKQIFDDAIEANVRGSIDQEFIANPQVQLLLKHFLNKDSDFRLVESYGKEFSEILSIKIHEYLNVGFFIDNIVINAYKHQHNYDLIRKAMNTLLEYSFKQVEQINVMSVLDISYAVSNDVFTIELSFTKEEFKIATEHFKKDELLKALSEQCNYISIDHFKKRSKVTISALWFKNEELKKFHSYFYSETLSKHETPQAGVPLKLALDENPNVAYEPRDLRTEDAQAKKLALARKFALFIKNFRKGEENPKELESISRDDVDDYLTRYPRQESLSMVDDEIRDFILKLLKDDNLYNGITDYIQKIANSNLDPQVEKIQQVLSGKSLADIEEIIKIKGVTDNWSDENTMVKGWAENADNETFRVEGVTEKRDDEIWEAKKSELVNKIQQEVIRIKGSGQNIIQDDIIRIVSQEVNADPKDIAVVVKEIVEEAVAGELTKKDKLNEAFPLQFLASNGPADAEKQKLEAQIARMKKLMAQMKAEVVKLRDESQHKERTPEVSSQENQKENLELKAGLAKALEMIRGKERMIQKLRDDFAVILENKDEKIASLEARSEHFKEEVFKVKDSSDAGKIDQLEAENKLLTARLDLANRKINIISDNLEKQDNDLVTRKDREISNLKTTIQTAQALVDKLKQDKSDLENKVIEEREKFIRLRDEKSSSNPASNNDPEKDLLIANLMNDKKAMDEKFKLQSIELKKLEQKLKFTTATLEEAQRKKGGSGGSGAKSNETYIKQLEHATGRIAEATAELSEKKKELIKLKQENTFMASRLAELEKKLNSEKKAS